MSVVDYVSYRVSTDIHILFEQQGRTEISISRGHRRTITRSTFPCIAAKAEGDGDPDRSQVTLPCDRLRLPYPLPFYKIRGLLPSVLSRNQALPVYTE